MHWMIFLHNAPGHPPKKLNKHYFSIIFHHKLHITTYSFNPCVLNNNVARLQLFQPGCSILISSCLFSDSLNSRWLNFPDFKCKHIFLFKSNLRTLKDSNQYSDRLCSCAHAHCAKNVTDSFCCVYFGTRSILASVFFCAVLTYFLQQDWQFVFSHVCMYSSSHY